MTYIQQEFNIIKDSVQRVKLPTDLKVEDSRAGVPRNEQRRMNVISRCARYGETLLKILSRVKAESVTEGDLEDLVTVVIAQLRFLQEEHQLVLVNGGYGDSVERNYRNFRTHTSMFPPDALQALETAVRLSSFQEHNQRGRGRSYGRGGRGFFPRGDRGARSYYSSQSGGRIPNYRGSGDYNAQSPRPNPSDGS